MKVIVGLGNPGEKYAKNRHNVGFLVLDQLAEVRWESKFEAMICKVGDTLLVKPQTFMNRSGVAVGEIVNFYKVSTDDLIVVHDDLDIRLGEYKIQKEVGPKVHNGVNSIEECLGRKDFWRVRLGVDNRVGGEFRTSGDEYVLSDFTPEETQVIDSVIEKAVKEL